MAKQIKNALSHTRVENFPEWYQQVIKGADLAETSDTRGCMVIKPWGYAIWEEMKSYLDDRFKESEHENAYFPLLIPLSFLEKEAEHAEGFATECAVVTHHRLEAIKDSETGTTKMIPQGELTEPYVIRPTSETVIGAAFSRWITSYRDLPLLINQWANVMRWEMRTRLFLRTAEFLWQEGHTAHATREEALEETKFIHSLYESFLRERLAIPVITGEKTEAERFPGAENTYTVEAMVQDKKAIQAGTSHYLGQNFALAQNITFLDKDNKKQHAHTTSWGVSTRLIGTLIMAHSDDDGLILPPRIAPKHIVIIPFLSKKDSSEDILAACQVLRTKLRALCTSDGTPIRVHLDKRDIQGSTKKWEWVRKGIPIRIEIGPKDLESGNVCLSRRDEAPTLKSFLKQEELCTTIVQILDEIQSNLLERATQLRDQNILECRNLSTFEKHWKLEQPGWLLCPWCGSREEEEKLAKRYKISVRCIPDKMQKAPAPCILTGEHTTQWVLWARSY